MDPRVQYYSLGVATFILSIFLSFPPLADSVCDPSNSDPENLVPFPPSLKPLPQLRMLEYNGNRFSLSCELLICSITMPVTYKWFFSKTKDGEGVELVKADHETGDSDVYHFEGQDIFIHSDYSDWDAITGYYWCAAENEHGKATSSQCQIDKSEVKPRAEALPPVKVNVGQSVRIAMEKPAFTDKDVPLRPFYELGWASGGIEILTPLAAPSKVEGRFVIGSNFDLYVLEAKTSDACDMTQQFIEHSTVTNFAYREGKLEVINSPYSGAAQTGFFDQYKDYVFVRGVKASFTCVPKTKQTVMFKKDGKDLEVGTDQTKKMFRTDYSLWFNNPSETDSGKYTCYYKDRSGKQYSYDQQVRVIGSPVPDCDFTLFIIRTPNSNVTMNCKMTSDFLELEETTLYWNDEPFESSQGLTYQATTTSKSGSYETQVYSDKLKTTDTGVLRFVSKAKDMTRAGVLQKLGLSPTSSTVWFNDFRVLPFETREEVSIAVFVMPLRVNENDNQLFDALIGGKNFRLMTTIFGSPLPKVSWAVDGEEIVAGNPKYSFMSTYTVVFLFYIKEVEKSCKVEAIGTHEVDGVTHVVTDEFQITAHEPIQWKPDMRTEVFGFTGQEMNVLCAATQKDGKLTADLKFEWIDTTDGSTIFDGVGRYTIVTGDVTDDSGVKYLTSTLKFLPRTDITEKFACNASLVANGVTLQFDPKNISVATGDQAAQPTDFWLDEKKSFFNWKSSRKAGDYSYKDVIEYAAFFKETENEEPTWKKMGETLRNLGKDGFFDVTANLPELTYGEWITFPPGNKLKFRLFTENTYGRSEYASDVPEIITPDGYPEAKMTNVAVGPDPDGSSKVLVSWDPFPRVEYGSYDGDGCCIHVQVEAMLANGTVKTMTLDCVDPADTEVLTGWDDMEPFTVHKVTTWFSNKAGEAEKVTAEGYNKEGPPEAPKLLDDQPEDKQNSIAVKFEAMSDDDINGNFTAYELIIRDEDGNIVGRQLITEQGTPGDVLEITVAGLNSSCNYTAELLVHNTEFSTSTGEFPRSTSEEIGVLPQEQQNDTLAAGAGLIMALILLLILLIILILIGIYYAKNRSHAYRVQRNESRFKPKDVEFLPRKDETNKFNEYVPDETKLPFISPHRHTGPVDLDDDSLDLPFGGDEDLDGYNEDGSFIGAYVEDTVYRNP